MKASKLNGFTLLEVIIALAIFSIATVSIYFLVNQSLNLVNYSNNKLLTIQKGIELTTRIIDYNYDINSISNNDDFSNNFHVKVNIEPTIAQRLQKIILLITYNNVETKFIFYQKK